MSNVAEEWLSHLKWFDESPEQCPNPLSSTEQFDQTHYPEQPEEVDTNNGWPGLEDVPNNGELINNVTKYNTSVLHMYKGIVLDWMKPSWASLYYSQH